ncbi:EAL domain, c-di-GMP-specific phosphodiesterase class I (or its enzymatically inactive variant) [Desulfonatronum thiosulfatophilum]|uniref:EAL domain, c-di-GMP-specific phosphodiesterase class I (Or its enzymatically inactive variant) n=1 Tax=Desulfonatronum thiosulfatophilum TaxID=617002 RepID=A0A1G6CCC0_9BACT|nr:EAL domain-containing protein [Desulfonatronum thiosulfatophilum]SDB30530.1 EAL domain, c-di-GMP-specific phosphodiesterase class I (or its enzymatically inactive variant) [Desulfonatronum thiosulfatophilum]
MTKPHLPLSFSEIDMALEGSGLITLPGRATITLESAFQPVYSLAHKRMIGMEALIRAKDDQGRSISPPALFSACNGITELIVLDRMARHVHVRNFTLLNDPLSWLFLNVHPRVVQQGKKMGSFFSELLDRFALPAHRVVIEIVEHPIEDTNLLQETVEYYKSLGCLIALDDFGAGGSNFERVWSLKPHIIKLDRSFVVQATARPDTRDILPDLVYLLRQAGCLVLMEGVETFEQALIAMESGVDFVQGYHFAMPTPNPMAMREFSFDALFSFFKSFAQNEETSKQDKIRHYQKLFDEMVREVESGISLEVAGRTFFAHEKCVRCFLITSDGAQVGLNMLSPKYAQNQDPRFKPLENTSDADWSRRFYLRRAVANPGRVQCTRPYLSLTGAHMCVTFSRTVQTPQGTLVLCCDVNWD